MAPRRRLGLVAAVALASVAFVAVACGRPPGPEGWAGPQPVTVNGQQLVLITSKGKLYALPNTGNPTWQFPAADKNTIPASDALKTDLKSRIDQGGFSSDQATALKARVDSLTVSGPPTTILKDALKADSTDQTKDAVSQITTQIDTGTAAEKKAVSNVKAIYGDLGLSADGKTVYVPAFGGYLFALDTSDGHVRWTDNLVDGMVGGVAVDGDAVYFGTKGDRVFAADAATGKQRWNASLSGESWTTPTVDGDTVYATSLDGAVYALDKAGGHQKWKFTGAGSGIASRPVVASGSVFVGSFDNKLYSLNTSDGTMNWAFSADNWIWGAPVVDNGVVYAASLDNKVYAVDAQTGKSRWDKPYDFGSPVRSGPVVAGGGLVVADRAGDVVKLDLQTGQPQGDKVPTGSRIYANLTADKDARVYVSPQSAALVVMDAKNELAKTDSFPLP